jgi:tetratricopeptide (TPR) repeat protein
LPGEPGWRRFVAQAYARLGDWPAALATAAQFHFEETRTRTLASIARLCARTASGESFLQAATAISDPSFRWDAIAALAVARARLGHWEEARETARRLRKPAHRAVVLSACVLAQLHAGQLAVAADTAREIPEPAKRAEMLGRIAHAQATAGHRLSARRTFGAALGAACNSGKEDGHVRARVLERLARTLSRAGAFRAAGRVRDAATHSPDPGRRAEELATLAWVWHWAGRTAKARTTAAAALAAAHAIPDNRRRAEALQPWRSRRPKWRYGMSPNTGRGSDRREGHSCRMDEAGRCARCEDGPVGKRPRRDFADLITDHGSRARARGRVEVCSPRRTDRQRNRLEQALAAAEQVRESGIAVRWPLWRRPMQRQATQKRLRVLARSPTRSRGRKRWPRRCGRMPPQWHRAR